MVEITLPRTCFSPFFEFFVAAVRPQQNRFLLFKDDMKIPDDARSIISRIKVE